MISTRATLTQDGSPTTGPEQPSAPEPSLLCEAPQAAAPHWASGEKPPPPPAIFPRKAPARRLPRIPPAPGRPRPLPAPPHPRALHCPATVPRAPVGGRRAGGTAPAIACLPPSLPRLPRPGTRPPPPAAILQPTPPPSAPACGLASACKLGTPEGGQVPGPGDSRRLGGPRGQVRLPDPRPEPGSAALPPFCLRSPASVGGGGGGGSEASSPPTPPRLTVVSLGLLCQLRLVHQILPIIHSGSGSGRVCATDGSGLAAPTLSASRSASEQ